MLPRDLKKLLGMDYEPPVETWVISFPKSGRTWHRALVGSYLAKKYHKNMRDSLKVRRLTRKVSLPIIEYSHNGADFHNTALPSDAQVADPRLWEGKKVIFLVRDVKDTVVSCYFHARYRNKIFDGPIGEFVRSPHTGVEKILTAFNRWHENRKKSQTSIVQSYELMHQDAVSCLTQTIEFAGFGEPDQRYVCEAVEFCRAGNMRRLERTGFFRTTRMGYADTPEGYKVRSAKIGDYVNHLSPEDIAYINKMEQRMGNPLAEEARAHHGEVLSHS